MKQLCTFFVIAILCICKPNYSPAQVNVNDSLALVDLYNSTDGAHWNDNTGWLNGPVSNWFGVVLTGNRVTNLILNFNNLKGAFPSSIGNLTMLTAINMFDNHLTGTLPASFNKLHLYGIFLMNNQLTGRIPAFDSSLLYSIGLGGNQFTGTLPVFPHMEKIQEIDLDNNQLTGNIPEEYNKLSSQASIGISGNQLIGVIPTSFANLDSNSSILIENNHFTFDGLEYIVANSTHYFFTYSPQLPIPIRYTSKGSFGKLSVHAGGTLSNNTYQWYKNNSLYKTIIGDSTFIPDSEGTYFVKVNNSIVTNLQLVSDTIHVETACSSPPSNTATKNIQSTSATATWNASQGAIRYIVKYKVAGTSAFTTINTTNTSCTLTGLNSNTKYVWKVRAKCPLTFSAFTPLNHFKTLPAFASISQSDNDIQKANKFTLYPNPASNNLNIVFNAAKRSSYAITIYDLQGKLLLSKTGTANSGNNNFTLDIHTLTSGMYIVKIYADDKITVMKLVKE